MDDTLSASFVQGDGHRCIMTREHLLNEQSARAPSLWCGIYKHLDSTQREVYYKQKAILSNTNRRKFCSLQIAWHGHSHFVIELGLEVILFHISGDVIHRFKNLSSWHIRGLDGSIVIGITKWGGSHSPFSPYWQWLVGNSFQNWIRYEIIKFITDFVVLEHHFRWERRIIILAFKLTFERL